MKPQDGDGREQSMAGRDNGNRGPAPSGAGEGPPDVEPLDDVDRAFGRLAPLPVPRGFSAGVLRAVYGRAPVAEEARLGVREAVWALAGASALTLVLVLAFLTAQAFVWGEALDLVAISLAGGEAVADVRDAALSALLDAFPWLEVLGLAAALAALAYCTRRLGRALGDRPAGAA